MPEEQVQPVVETPVEEVQEESTLSPTEELAYDQGWRPKNEFNGNPDEWRPAKEWLERGELISKIKRLGNEVNDMRQGYQQLYKNHLESTKQAYQQALSDLRVQRRLALENDDFATVDQLEERMDQVKDHVRTLDAPQPVQQVQPQTQSESYQKWIARNPWYLKDDQLHIAADTAVTEILKKNGGPMDPDLLGRLVEEQVKSTFPDKFGKKSQEPASPSIGGTHRGVQRNTTSKYGDVEKSMSAEERHIMDTYVNKLGLMTKDEYMADYVKARS